MKPLLITACLLSAVAGILIGVSKAAPIADANLIGGGR